MTSNIKNFIINAGNIVIKTKVVLVTILLFYIANYIYFGSQLLFYPTVFTRNLQKMGVSYSQVITSERYPPLHFLSLCAGTSILGNRLMLANGILNTFYLLILLIFSFLLGKRLRDEATGLIATILVSLYPLTYRYYFQVSPDFPLMGLTVMAIYLLISSDYFLNTKYSILFAIAFAWGMMVKQPFGSFLIGPIIYSLFEAIRKCIANKEFNRLGNILIFSVISYALVMPFYFPSLFRMKLGMLEVEQSGLMWHDFRNLRIFSMGLWESQLSPLFFITLVFGVYYFIKKADNKFNIILFLWILIPNLILIFLPTRKSPRYFLPQQPAFAVISAFGLRQIFDKRTGKILLCVIIIAGVIQFCKLTYGIGPDFNKFDQFRYHDYERTLEEIKYYNGLLDNIHNIIKSRIDDKGFTEKNKCNILILGSLSLNGLGDYLDINMQTYFWCKNTNNVDIQFVYLMGGMDCVRYKKEDIEKYDYVLYMTNDNMELKNQAFYVELKKDLSRIEWEGYRHKDDKMYWQQYKYFWDNIVNRIGDKELIFRENNIEVYLYRIIKI